MDYLAEEEAEYLVEGGLELGAEAGVVVGEEVEEVEVEGIGDSVASSDIDNIKFHGDYQNTSRTC